MYSSEQVYTTGDSVNWYLRGQSNGPMIMLRKHGGAGGYTNRRGALGWMDNSGGMSEYLNWTDAGYFGIGTPNPYGQLSLNNQIAMTANSNDPVAGYPAAWGTNGQAVFNSYYVLNSDGYGTYPRYLDIASVGSPNGSTGGGNIRFLTNSVANNAAAVERMRVSSNGSVGIGTISPQSVLHTNGNIRIDAVSQAYNEGLALNASTDMSTPYVGIGFNSVGRTAAFSGAGAKWAIFYNYTPEQGPGGGVQGGLSFIQDNANTRMYMQASGNIGIGTTAPSEKLSVNGNISTKKLIVTQLGWSDDVFDKEYKLRNLSSLDQYIKENKHLPEIPTATEVKEKGISVGDNQALLLKKIEELTLYIIEINKRDQQQQRQIDKQAREIELLKRKK